MTSPRGSRIATPVASIGTADPSLRSAASSPRQLPISDSCRRRSWRCSSLSFEPQESRWASKRLRGRPAEQPLGAAIPRGDVPSRIARDHCVLGVVQQGSKYASCCCARFCSVTSRATKTAPEMRTLVVVEGGAVAAEAPAAAVRQEAEELFVDDHLAGPGRPQNGPLRRRHTADRQDGRSRTSRRAPSCRRTAAGPKAPLHGSSGGSRRSDPRTPTASCRRSRSASKPASLNLSGGKKDPAPVHSGTWSIRACSPVVNALRKATASSGKLANS